MIEVVLMNWNKKKIEEIAVKNVMDLCLYNPFLSSYVDLNDKTPLWDGHVFLYSDTNNTNLIGRIPVQIKGTTQKPNKNLTFRVRSKKDLEHYYNDGGVMYIVCYIHDGMEELYYSSLLPLTIASLLEQSESKSINIPLNKFPRDSKEVADVFLTFKRESERQHGKINKELLSFENVLIEQEHFSSFNFSIYSLYPEEINPIKELTKREVTVYAQPNSKYATPLPVDSFSEAEVIFHENLEVSLNGEILFSCAKEGYRKGNFNIRVAENVLLTFINEDKVIDGNESWKIEIFSKGKVDTYLKGMILLKGLHDKEDVRIKGEKFNLNFHSDLREGFVEELEFLLNLKANLELLSVPFDFTFQEIREVEPFFPILGRNNFSISKAGLKFDNNQEFGLFILPIASRKILTLVSADIENDKFELKNFFKEKFYCHWENKSEIVEISQFVLLEEEWLDCDNLEVQIVMESIKSIHYSEFERKYGIVNTFLLRLLNVYDRSKRSTLLQLAKELSFWLNDLDKSTYIILNKMQVLYRLDLLTQDDKRKIGEIYQTNLSDQTIAFACLVLLDKKDEAFSVYGQMDKETQDELASYPIYSLLKKDNST